MLFMFAMLALALAGPILPVTKDELVYVQDDPPVTHKVVFSVKQRVFDEEAQQVIDTEVGDLVLGLFGTVNPLTVDNFFHLANQTFGYGYRGTKFHRVIKGFMVQSGTFANTKSIYGPKFDDESFSVIHNKPGRLSMANAGPNTNSAQFFITEGPTPHLDGKHVVFGQLLGGYDILDQIASVRVDANAKPLDDVYVSDIQLIQLMSTKTSPHIPVNPVEMVASPPSYFWLYMCIICAAVGWLIRRVYFRRQYITDIKDVHFF